MSHSVLWAFAIIILFIASYVIYFVHQAFSSN